MRVCIVGCGNQGTGCAALLCGEEDVQELLLIDSRADMGRRTAEVLASLPGRPIPTLTVRCIDAREHDEITRCIAGSDLVINASAPVNNLPLMQTCLETGCHYVDLYSYPEHDRRVPKEQTLTAQRGLDEEFRDRRLLAVPSLGTGPGWVNLAAKTLIDGLDAVDTVVNRSIDWFDSELLLSPVTPEVLMEQWLGSPGPICTDYGRTVSRDLIQSAERYRFPDPVGSQTVFTTTTNNTSLQIASLSPVPIPHMEEKFAVLSGGLGLRDILLTAVSRQTAKHRGAENMLALFGTSFVPTSGLHVGEACDRGLIRDAAFVTSVEVTGTLQGRRRQSALFCTSSLEATLARMPWAPPGVLAGAALPVLLTLMIGRGQVEERGVRLAAELACAGLAVTAVERWGLRVSG